MTNLSPASVYKLLDVFGRQEKGFFFIVFQKKKTPPDLMYIRKAIDKENVLGILVQSKFTRIGQIKELLLSGVSTKEIRAALGKEISVGETEFLDKFEQGKMS